MVVVVAVQLHREVRPEPGLVGIVEHIVVNKRRRHSCGTALRASMKVSGHVASRRGIIRRAVDRPPWNKVYEDLPDTGDRPNAEAATSPVTWA